MATRERIASKAKVGDTVRVTDVQEGVVTAVAADGAGFSLGDRGFLYYNGPGRTVEILESAPLPWQAGDIMLVIEHGKPETQWSVRVRQDDAYWLDNIGMTCRSDDPEECELGEDYKVIVRGGIRV